MKTLIIGLGSMGSAAALALAKRGHDVVGFDQFDVPTTKASHHGATRIFRIAYYEHPDYVPLLREALEGWRRLETDGDIELLTLNGGLYAGPDDCSFIRETMRASDEYDLGVERMDPDEARTRWPMFRIPDGYAALYESTAGFVRPEDAVATNVRLAAAHGATLHARTHVTGWSVRDNGDVEVRTSGSSGGSSGESVHVGDRLIVTTGAWSPQHLHDLPLTTTRQILAWIRPDGDASAWCADRFPIWGFMHEDEKLHYGFPSVPPKEGAKISIHAPLEETDPDDVCRDWTDVDDARMRDVVARSIPGLGDAFVRTCVCLYCNTSDGHPVIDVDGPVVHACGFSGHGFKFVPVIGEVLADLAAEGSTSRPIDFLSGRRFEDGGRR